MLKKLVVAVICALFMTRDVHCALNDYVRSMGRFFGYDDASEVVSEDTFNIQIPYEVSTVDEKFISQAAELTGVALSQLDSCQQRVVLKLKTDCQKLNDEELAKLAVHLLNCQSYVEGRQIYPCTEDMSLKDCTIKMDSDTWTSYHLMSNRARAVCYAVRQSQFRGLAEQTVNKLMAASKDQLRTLEKIAHNQDDLKDVAETTFNLLTKGHNTLLQQQSDIEKVQFHGQLIMEDNINRLQNEKNLITETHFKLVDMAREVQNKIQQSTEQLVEQTDESTVNHKQLLEDLVVIQQKTEAIFAKMEQSSNILMQQNEEIKAQYDYTIKKLTEVNQTVHHLVSLAQETLQSLEDRFAWMSNALGDTNFAFEKMHLLLWHIAFILFAMLGCAFLSASFATRFIVMTLPPINLGLAFYLDDAAGEKQYLSPVNLLGVTLGLVFINAVFSFAYSWKKSKPISDKVAKLSPPKAIETKLVHDTSFNSSFQSSFRKNSPSASRERDEDENSEFTSFSNRFPLKTHLNNTLNSSRNVSRSSTPRSNVTLTSSCYAKTKLGTPCKLGSLPGKNYCYRHERGDSVRL